MTKDEIKVRVVSSKDNIRVKTQSRLYEAILYNQETKVEENRSDPMEYADAVAWGKSNKDEETYVVFRRFAGFKEPTP